MLNVFKIKKFAGLIICCIFPTIAFYLCITSYGILITIAAYLVTILTSILLVNVALLNNPFTSMLKGKGILTLNIDSTGVIRPFISTIQNPYVYTKVRGSWYRDIWDRDLTYMLAVPKKVKAGAITKTEGGLTIDLSDDEYNKGRFALFHYPVLIYNAQLRSIITKDFIGKQETKFFAEHQVLYLNRQIEDLTNHIRDFSRYVIHSLKPQGSIFSKWWIWVIIIVVIGLFAVLLAPSILQQLGVTGESVKGAISPAAQNLGSMKPT